MKFLAIITTLIATAAVIDFPVFPFVWEDCYFRGTTDQTVTNFTIKQNFCPRKNHTVIVTGPVIRDIIAPATVIYTDNLDFCALLAAAGTPCPVAVGTTALTFDVLSKPFLPVNLITQFRYEARNGYNTILFCQDASIVLRYNNGTCV
ncbi:MAG: hypothetical protein BYD32DRAFT_465763 [Podila humilis]|nr:MAG: hypothetical protein BYD32DRAFT_465763 [Podila humilis]